MRIAKVALVVRRCDVGQRSTKRFWLAVAGAAVSVAGLGFALGVVSGSQADAQDAWQESQRILITGDDGVASAENAVEALVGYSIAVPDRAGSLVPTAMTTRPVQHDTGVVHRDSVLVEYRADRMDRTAHGSRIDVTYWGTDIGDIGVVSDENGSPLQRVGELPFAVPGYRLTKVTMLADERLGTGYILVGKSHSIEVSLYSDPPGSRSLAMTDAQVIAMLRQIVDAWKQ